MILPTAQPIFFFLSVFFCSLCLGIHCTLTPASSDSIPLLLLLFLASDSLYIFSIESRQSAWRWRAIPTSLPLVHGRQARGREETHATMRRLRPINSRAFFPCLAGDVMQLFPAIHDVNDDSAGPPTQRYSLPLLHCINAHALHTRRPPPSLPAAMQFSSPRG